MEAGLDEAGYESRTQSPLVASQSQMPGSSSPYRQSQPSSFAVGRSEMGSTGWQGRISQLATRRPFDFWQWESIGTYAEFLAGLIVLLGVLQLIFGKWGWYIDT